MYNFRGIKFTIYENSISFAARQATERGIKSLIAMQSRVEILEPSRFQSPFHLNQVVEVATAHPFYSPSHEYPLTPDKVNQIMLRESPSTDVVSLLSRFAITQKQDL